MKRFLLFLALGPCLSLGGPLPPIALGEAIQAPMANRELSVVGGKVLFVCPSDRGFNWDLSLLAWRRKKTTEVQFAGGGQWHGWYLRFDPKGKDPSVTLSKKKGPGTQWTVTFVGRGRYTVQATKGKFKGWYLTLGKGLPLVDNQGAKYTGYGAILAEKPKRSPKFEIFEVAK